MLTRMFGDATRPFYQSTEMIFLEKINAEAYSFFITRHFLKSGRKVEPGVVADLLDWTRAHTWYLQYVCNRIYETELDFTPLTIKSVIPDILLGFEPFYMEYRSLVTRHQWQLLKAISQSSDNMTVTSGNFIKQFNLTNASTVKRGIETLLAKEMIYKKDGQYFIYDVFFSHWLETQEI